MLYKDIETQKKKKKIKRLQTECVTSIEELLTIYRGYWTPILRL